jgi:hypothetical protein
MTRTETNTQIHKSGNVLSNEDLMSLKRYICYFEYLRSIDIHLLEIHIYYRKSNNTIDITVKS